MGDALRVREAGLGGPQLLLGPLALGDIADDGANHLVAAQGDHANADLNVHESSVLPAIRPLADEAASLLQGALYGGVHVLARVRNKVVDFHATQLVCRVSKHLLVRWVGLQDTP